MPVIDPSGLFEGRRLAACSDKARLYYPWLFCAANGNARLELHPLMIIGHCFRSFTQPPTEGEIWNFFEEYNANFLALPYQIDDRIWVQFITKDKYLKKHKTHEDERSPEPPKKDLDEYLRRYEAWKENRIPKVFGNLSEVFTKSFGEVSEKFRQGDGIGIGIGIGDGDDDDAEKSAAKKQSSSSSSFPLLSVQEVWNRNRGPMRESRTITKHHQRLFLERVKDGFNQETCQQAIVKMANTPYFVGDANGVIADLTWLLETNKKTGVPNFQNVLNGDYEPHKKRVKSIKQAASYKELANHG